MALKGFVALFDVDVVPSGSARGGGALAVSETCAGAGNGHCEALYNTLACEWDGGDCVRRFLREGGHDKGGGPPPHHIAAFALVGLFLVGLVAYAAYANGHCRRPPKPVVLPSPESLRATANLAIDEFSTEVELTPSRPSTAETAELPGTPTSLETAIEFDPQECPICLNDFSEESLSSKERIIRLPCGHIYHRSCIVRWLAQPTQSGNKPKFNCPLCKHVVNEPLPALKRPPSKACPRVAQEPC